MPIAVTLALLVFWLAVAWRQYQRGDLLLAGVCVMVGVVMTIYRYRLAVKRTEQTTQTEAKDPLK